MEPHKFVPWDDEPSLCFGHGFYGCAKPKDDPIHQPESQPEPEGWMLQEAGIVHPWEDTHQQESQQCGSCAGNLPNHEEGCFYKLAQERQPATHPAEGSRVEQWDDAGEYRSHLEAELLNAQIKIAELEKHAHVLINGGMASKEWSRAERQMRKLLEERSK